MRNLRDGAEKLRMLDLKIGEKTASSGWKGEAPWATEWGRVWGRRVKSTPDADTFEKKCHGGRKSRKSGLPA